MGDTLFVYKQSIHNSLWKTQERLIACDTKLLNQMRLGLHHILPGWKNPVLHFTAALPSFWLELPLLTWPDSNDIPETLQAELVGPCM